MDADPLVSLSKEENAAVARLAFTEDGRLFHRYLRRVLETVVDMTDPSTLLVQNGRRSLARDLMRLMAEGIEASSGRTGNTESILTRARGAVSVAGPRGTRRRVTAEPEPPADASPSGTAGSGTA